MLFVLLAFATYLTWTTITSLLPFRVPNRLQPFAVVALAYGLHFLPSLWLMIIAAAGGVATLVALAGTSLDPWDATRLKNLIPKDVTGKRKRKTPEGVGVRIPTL